MPALGKYYTVLPDGSELPLCARDLEEAILDAEGLEERKEDGLSIYLYGHRDAVASVPCR